MDLIQQLKRNRRLTSALLLAGMSIFSLTLSLIRYCATGSLMYLFLNWNLFLAFIPWLLSTIMVIYGCYNKKILLAFLLLSWLLFFPNSPYILTDLFHLRKHSAAPVWFDWALILSFAWTGLMFGFASLADIEKLLCRYTGRKNVPWLVVTLLFVAAFGVYMGRFLRWNSWDVISDPIALCDDVLQRFVHPFRHLSAWLITLLVGCLLNMMYFSLRLARRQ